VTSPTVTTGTAASPPAGAAVVRVDGVSKVFGHGPAAVRALDRISLQAARGEFVCLVGASGCGKSTLLHLLAGLDSPTSGTLAVEGRTALMFQEAALFPWLTVAGNVSLALRLRGVGRADRRPLVAALLEMVHLQEFRDKRPHELSGGMRQRVALARALAQDADVLLMDEPFGSLDAQTRNLMQKELLRIWAATGKTILFVTHSVDEAVFLADRIVVMTARPGMVREVIEVGLPRPRDRTSREFIAVRGKVLTELDEEFEKARAKELSPD